jgi:hypothetical protein
MTNAVNIAQSGSNNQTMRNRIINGGMYIWQRGTTVTSVGIDTFGPDRYKQWANDGGETGRSTWSQSTDVPSGQGFPYSCKIAVTTAQASFSSSQGYSFEQRIEANNIYDLAYGTAGAQPITLSFWAKSNKTGTYTVAIGNNGTAATNVYKQTVSLTSSWAKYTVTIPGDTSLATTSTANGQGMFVSIMLSNGATSAVTNTWQTYSLQNRTATGQVNFYDSTSNELYITGVQLEEGTAASPFENRLYGTELSLCQRYYSVVTNGTGSAAYGPYGLCRNALTLCASSSLPVTMRATPSASFTVNSGTNVLKQDGQTFPVSSMSAAGLSVSQVGFETIIGTSSLNTTGCAGFYGGSFSINASAEL